MILPDSRCEIHGETLALYHTIDRGRPTARAYCRACSRERAHKRRGGLSRSSPLSQWCGKGHPKTSFNYGMYGSKKRCKACARERGRHKR